ncbi:MAG: phosphatidate cytidylyltransferase [Paracoccaceae bacterium]|nr:phosphatidate cytidylyltransferase [Paracoccaceae bacterium]
MSVAGGGRWGDLPARVLSGIAMLLIGGAAVWLGGGAFAALVVPVVGLMMWELARMTAGVARDLALPLGVFAAACLAVILLFQPPLLWPRAAVLLLPVLAGVLMPRRDRAVHAGYALLIMLTGYGLITLRAEGGVALILWLILLVVVSDIMGYFAGRILGGPKFWPRISPKKTWSGTVAGWLGAVVVGAAFAGLGQGGWWLLWLSPLVAFAGQLGDIAESWIKRRAGVKDSSALIPGHGGVLDRFDALVFAVVLAFALSLLIAVPVGG